MTSSDQDFQGRLKKLYQLEPEPGLKQVVVNRLVQVSDGSVSPETVSQRAGADIGRTGNFGGGRGIVRISVVLAAACALVCLGWYFYNNSKSEEQGRGDGELASVEFETEKLFLFIEARQINTERYAMLQEMTGFEILKKGKGELIQNYTITDILDNGIEVNTPEGDSEFLSQDVLQSRLDSTLVRELGRLRTNISDGELLENGLERLGQWAKFGNEAAIQMLETVAYNQQHPLHGRANDLLFGGKQERVLKKLLAVLASDKDSYRLNAIRSLSKIDAPHARAALRRIAFKSGDKLRKAALQGLRELKDATCLKQLFELMHDPDVDPSLRKAAEETYKSIIENSSGD
ncbi:HEAT repeat domain-containing protein [Planctomycetota bacterium]